MISYDLEKIFRVSWRFLLGVALIGVSMFFLNKNWTILSVLFLFPGLFLLIYGIAMLVLAILHVARAQNQDEEEKENMEENPLNITSFKESFRNSLNDPVVQKGYQKGREKATEIYDRIPVRNKEQKKSSRNVNKMLKTASSENIRNTDTPQEQIRKIKPKKLNHNYEKGL